jgi:hypothetical protein
LLPPVLRHKLNRSRVAISLFQTSSFRRAWPGRDTHFHLIPA